VIHSYPWHLRSSSATTAARLKLYAESNKLRAEGSKLCAKGNKLRAEGDKLYAKGNKPRAEGNKLYAKGNKLRAEGNESVLQVFLALNVCQPDRHGPNYAYPVHTLHKNDRN